MTTLIANIRTAYANVEAISALLAEPGALAQTPRLRASAEAARLALLRAHDIAEGDQRGEED